MSSNPVIYGWLTPELNVELKKLLEEEEWPPPEEPSPEFSEVLIASDVAFTLKELWAKCDELGLSKSGHKKILAARLLKAGEEDLTEIAQETIKERNERNQQDRESH